MLPETQQPAPEPVVAQPVYAAKKKRKACTVPSVCPAPAASDYSNPNQTPAVSDQQLNGILQRQ
jgi:hypothetical protein